MKASLLLIATLFLTMMAGLTAGYALASNVTVETTTVTRTTQPFTHPANDVSYDAYTREDEKSAQTQPISNGAVSYISGGVGDGGMQAMDMQANAYDLKVLFVAKGEYLANVDVTITDAKGNNILNATTDGPVLLVKLPAGKYTLIAKSDAGKTMTRKIRVDSHHLASYVLRYPKHD